MLCCLGCSAAGDENRKVFLIRFVRPEEMIVGTASLLVLPELPIRFKAINGSRVRVAVVEVPNLFGNIW
jgi:hypothetical protein